MSELYHWKYIKKVPVGNSYRYFYTWDEYRAFLKDPAAELAKSGVNAAKDIGKTAAKSTNNYVSNGKKRVERLSKSKNFSEIKYGSIKQANSMRDEGIKRRLNDLAKKAKNKWEKDKKAVKDTIDKGKKWFDDHLNPIAAYKRKKAEEERKRAEANKSYEEKRDSLAKKYKYIDKKVINGKTRYFYSKDEIDAYNRKQDYIANEPVFMHDVKKSTEPYTREEDAMLVNPKFDSFDKNYSYNCAECSAIYELRRRGYDVESNGESGKGPNSDEYNTEKRFELFYKNPETNHIDPAKSDAEFKRYLQQEFAQYPPGSRGDISFKWKNYDAGHSIAWEKDGEGNVHFIDAQPAGHGNAVEYSMDELVSSIDHEYTVKQRQKGHIFKQKVGFTNVTRTDNLELKPEVKKICKNSSDTKPNVQTDNVREYRLSNGTAYVNRRKMTEKEAVTKYPNLLNGESYKKLTSSEDDNGITIIYEYGYETNDKKRSK